MILYICERCRKIVCDITFYSCKWDLKLKKIWKAFTVSKANNFIYFRGDACTTVGCKTKGKSSKRKKEKDRKIQKENLSSMITWEHVEHTLLKEWKPWCPIMKWSKPCPFGSVQILEYLSSHSDRCSKTMNNPVLQGLKMRSELTYSYTQNKQHTRHKSLMLLLTYNKTSNINSSYFSVFCFSDVRCHVCCFWLRVQLLQNRREAFQSCFRRDVWMWSARQRLSLCCRAGIHDSLRLFYQLFNNPTMCTDWQDWTNLYCQNEKGLFF